MTWLSQGIIDDLGAAVAGHEETVRRAREALENHRRAAAEAQDVLNRHQRLAAEAKFLLTIAHGAAPVPAPGEIREAAGEEGVGLAIGNIRMALPPDAPPALFGRLAESMRALYAAAHVVALHADERARAGAPQPPLVPGQAGPAAAPPVPRAVAALIGRRVRVENAGGGADTGLLGSVEGGQLTLLDDDGVPFAWPPLDEVESVQAWPPDDGAAAGPDAGTDAGEGTGGTGAAADGAGPAEAAEPPPEAEPARG